MIGTFLKDASLVTAPTLTDKIPVSQSGSATNMAITPGQILGLLFVGLTVYADNTAALAGGLEAGDLYRTSTGVLMIVF
jgi:hypothetical protein